MDFVTTPFVFLTPPSIEELQAFELPELIDLLSKYTADYINYLRNEGHFTRTNVLKEYVLVIQAAIEIKRETGAKTQQSPDHGIVESTD